MRSVLEEITLLRAGKPITVDYRNANRYRLLLQEDDGTKTAYYFTTPIYNSKTRKMVDLTFYTKGGAMYSVGSNANVTVSTDVRMENNEGHCLMSLPQKPAGNGGKELRCGAHLLYPTTNGIAMKAYVKGDGKVSFTIEVERPFLEVRANDKCFALMLERFKPFVVFSCIGTVDTFGQVIAPAKLEYQKLSDRKYRLTVCAQSPLGTHVLFEGNLYEPKLFQDTTVESLNSRTNNAFGSTAFIGRTAVFGEQWLYSRLDHGYMTELMDKHINKIILHLPKYNKSSGVLTACRVTARFCSFGSNWENKVAGGNLVAESVAENAHHGIDLTPLIVDPRAKSIMRSEGFILKQKVKDNGFSVIATGDSYFAPQVLEIHYR